MDKAKKNDWVEIENLVLTPDERAPQVPDDTKATPLMMWWKTEMDPADKTHRSYRHSRSGRGRSTCCMHRQGNKAG